MSEVGHSHHHTIDMLSVEMMVERDNMVGVSQSKHQLRMQVFFDI